MRSAGCCVNDVADRDFDQFVTRTANRPVTTGRISVTEALVVGAALALAAFGLGPGPQPRQRLVVIFGVGDRYFVPLRQTRGVHASGRLGNRIQHGHSHGVCGHQRGARPVGAGHRCVGAHRVVAAVKPVLGVGLRHRLRHG